MTENGWPEHKRVFIGSLREAQGMLAAGTLGSRDYHRVAWPGRCFLALSLSVSSIPHGVEGCPGFVGTGLTLPVLPS